MHLQRHRLALSSQRQYGVNDHIREVLAPALDGSYTMADVEAEILAGRAQLWVLGSSAVVTQVSEFPRRRTLRIWLAGGDLGEIAQSTGYLEEVAESMGCDRIEVDGRKGWGSILTGFKETRRTFIKEL